MNKRGLKVINQEYKYGFSMPENYVYKARPGLNEQVIIDISNHKNEPEWMREFRLKAYEIFKDRPMPTWGGDLSHIDFEKIH